jgi:phosphoglycerate dehydrogenase-like enzyme
VLKGLFVLHTSAYERIYGPREIAEIEQLVDIYAPQQTAASVKENPSILAEAEVIFSGWGMAPLDEAFLAAAPNLEAVFYGAGSIRGFATDAAWDRGILITSAYAANAIPTAEFALSQILFSLKRGWFHALAIKRDGRYPEKEPVAGAYESVVGLISLGMIGSYVAKLLQAFEVNVLTYTSSEEKAIKLGAERCALDEVFRRSDVVSLHTPWIEETEGQRPDLFAVLDVTYPEPPRPGSPLYTLPNVVLTPHIAGSLDNECRRMGRYAVNELKRYVNGEPPLWGISREQAARLA